MYRSKSDPTQPATTRRELPNLDDDGDDDLLYVVTMPFGMTNRWTFNYEEAYQHATGMTTTTGGDAHPEEVRISVWDLAADGGDADGE